MVLATAVPFGSFGSFKAGARWAAGAVFLSALRLRTLSGPVHVKLPVKGPSGHVTLSPSMVKLSPISFTGTFSAHAR